MAPIEIIAFAVSTSLLIGWQLGLSTTRIGCGRSAAGLFEVP